MIITRYLDRRTLVFAFAPLFIRLYFVLYFSSKYSEYEAVCVRIFGPCHSTYDHCHCRERSLPLSLSHYLHHSCTRILPNVILSYYVSTEKKYNVMNDVHNFLYMFFFVILRSLHVQLFFYLHDSYCSLYAFCISSNTNKPCSFSYVFVCVTLDSDAIFCVSRFRSAYLLYWQCMV